MGDADRELCAAGGVTPPAGGLDAKDRKSNGTTRQREQRLVVCDLSVSPNVDLAGVRMPANLHMELQASGIRLRLVAGLPRHAFE